MEIDEEALMGKVSTVLVDITGRLVWAILVFIVGMMVVRLLNRAFKKLIRKRDWDPTLETFLSSALMFVLYLTLIVGVVTILGVPASAFIAILGSAGLAIGLALQGSLSNVAGGVLLLVLRPLRVGDFVEADGSMGTVESINLFYTQVITPDNQVLHLPNGKLANNKILNFSQKDTRRVTIEVGIGYEDDVVQTREILLGLAKADERILPEPAPAVIVNSLGDSAVELKLWTWVNRPDFGGVLFSLRESVKGTLLKEGISIPYPQRDVHLYQKGTE